MLDQLFTYHIENPLMIISLKSGSWEHNCIRLVVHIGQLVKVAIKWKSEKGVGRWGKRYWRVLVSRIAGDWDCVQLVQ
jgi:hypothetical protein